MGIRNLRDACPDGAHRQGQVQLRRADASRVEYDEAKCNAGRVPEGDGKHPFIVKGK